MKNVELKMEKAMRMALSVAIASICACAGVFATPVAVTYDENGNVAPAAAKDTLDRACSAVIAVDLATGRAAILTNVADIALATIRETNELLTKHTDFCVIDTFATGLEDARGSTNNNPNARIVLVDKVDIRESGDSKLVTLSWCYTDGEFENDASILAATTLTTNDFAAVWTGAPEQYEWGTTNAYRATATLPKATYGQQAFFKIDAEVRAPVDDGQTFNTYSDGSDYWIDFVPTNRYRIRLIGGRITTVQKVISQ